MIIADAVQHNAPATEIAMSAALTHALANGLGGPMTKEERHLWIVSVSADLQSIPGDLALEGIQRARMHCTRAAEVLPFVVGYVEDYPFRRRRRLQRLIALADAVGVEVA